jgi:hypothetical protein
LSQFALAGRALLAVIVSRLGDLRNVPEGVKAANQVAMLRRRGMIMLRRRGDEARAAAASDGMREANAR